MISRKFRFRVIHQYIYAISIGVVAFLYFGNWRFLDFKNVGWLYSGANTDKASAYLGWEFFRRNEWTLPLGQNDNFGLLPSNSISYSDSIPLLAIVFKLFSNYLGETFQYFGIWLLVCFILQSLFATLIVQLFSRNTFTLIVSSSLSVTFPFFLQRAPIHLALCGHFLILCSIYLFLKARRGASTSFAWLILNFCSLMIHPYLCAMVIVIYLAHLVNQTRHNLRSKKDLLVEASLNVIILFLILHFVLGVSLTNQFGVAKTPYGAYPWNLFSILNPRDWPRFLTFYPARDSSFETFSYPGLGSLLIIAIALILILVKRRILSRSTVEFMPLALAAAVLLLFAITNRVGIGDLRIVLFESSFLADKLSIFRASARMAWPFLYVLIFASLVFLVKALASKRLILLFIFTLSVQFADVRLGPEFLFPPKTENYSYSSTSMDANWSEIKGKYKRILVFPNSQLDVIGWPEIAIIANYLGVGTNSAYLARSDLNELKTLNTKIAEAVNLGSYDPESIYVVYSDSKVERIRAQETDKIWLLDGKTVILPQWYLKPSS